MHQSAASSQLYACSFDRRDPKQATQLLQQRFRDASALGDELAEYFAKRAQLDRAHSQALAELGEEPFFSDRNAAPLGFQPILDALALELAHLAKYHAAHAETSEQCDQLVRTAPEHGSWSQLGPFEDRLHDTARDLNLLEASLAREARNLTSNSEQVRHLATERVSSLQGHLNKAVAHWRQEATPVFQLAQKADSERLAILKDSVVQFHSSLATLANQLAQTAEKGRGNALAFSLDDELVRFSQIETKPSQRLPLQAAPTQTQTISTPSSDVRRSANILAKPNGKTKNLSSPRKKLEYLPTNHGSKSSAPFPVKAFNGPGNASHSEVEKSASSQGPQGGPAQFVPLPPSEAIALARKEHSTRVRRTSEASDATPEAAVSGDASASKVGGGFLHAFGRRTRKASSEHGEHETTSAITRPLDPASPSSRGNKLKKRTKSILSGRRSTKLLVPQALPNPNQQPSNPLASGGKGATISATSPSSSTNSRPKRSATCPSATPPFCSPLQAARLPLPPQPRPHSALSSPSPSPSPSPSLSPSPSPVQSTLVDESRNYLPPVPTELSQPLSHRDLTASPHSIPPTDCTQSYTEIQDGHTSREPSPYVEVESEEDDETAAAEIGALVMGDSDSEGECNSLRLGRTPSQPKVNDPSQTAAASPHGISTVAEVKSPMTTVDEVALASMRKTLVPSSVPRENRQRAATDSEMFPRSTNAALMGKSTPTPPSTTRALDTASLQPNQEAKQASLTALTESLFPSSSSPSPTGTDHPFPPCFSFSDPGRSDGTNIAPGAQLLEVTVRDTVNIHFSGGKATRHLVVGEMDVRLKEEITDQTKSSSVRVRLDKVEQLARVVPNKMFVQPVSSDDSKEYLLNLAAISSTGGRATIFKYQLQTNEIDQQRYALVMMQPQWHSDTNQVSLVLRYGLGPHIAANHLDHILFQAQVPNCSTIQSRPEPSSWDATTGTTKWTIRPNLSPFPGLIQACWPNLGDAVSTERPLPIKASWMAAHTLTDVTLCLFQGDKCHPFPSTRSTHSGAYLADPDDV